MKDAKVSYVLGYKPTLSGLALKKNKQQLSQFSLCFWALVMALRCQLYENTVVCIFFRTAWQKLMLEMGHLSR